MAKESLYTSETPSKIILRKTFQDEQTVRRNGGVPTDVTFSDGIASIDTGGISAIGHRITFESAFNGIRSIHIKFKINYLFSNYTYLFGVRNIYDTSTITYLRLNPDNTFYFLSGTAYLNGETLSAGSVTAEIGKWYDIVLILSTIQNNVLFVIGASTPNNSTLTKGGSSYDLTEIYNYALSAEEISNLYNGKRYRALTYPTPILDIRADAGIYDAQGDSLTNTDVEVVRDGDVRVMKFNGSTSSLALGTTIYHKNIETISFWYKSLSGKLISDQAFLYTPNVGTHSILLIIEGDSVIKLYSEDTTGVNALEYNIISYDDGCWHHYAFVRNVGTAYLYTDGVLVKTDNTMKTGKEIQYSEAIGRRVSDLYLNGSLDGMKIVQNYVMNAEEASQLYTSEVWRYQ